MIVTRIRDDGGPAYTVEWMFFYSLGRAVQVTHTIWVFRDSFLDRWLRARAR